MADTPDSKMNTLFEKIEKIYIAYFLTALFIIPFLVYSMSLFNGFVWDDEEQVVNNQIIQHIENIPYLFTTSTFNTGGAGLSGFYYKPLMPTVFSFIYIIFGPHAFGFHLISIIFHAANGILIFFLLYKLYTLQKIYHAKIISFISTTFFIVHPANTESVAYISAIQELLYVFFLLIALLYTLSYCKLPGRKKYLLWINLAIFLSLLAKESGVVTIPLVIGLVYLFKKQAILPMIISTPVVFLFYLVLRYPIAHTLLSLSNPLVPIAQAPLSHRLLTIPYTLFSYIRLAFFPKDLFVAQHTVIQSVFDFRFYVSFFVTVFVISLIFLLVRINRSGLFVYFLFWIVCCLSLLLNIYPLDMTLAERWLYGPLIGVSSIIGFFISKLVQKRPRIQPIIVVIALCISVVFSFRGIQRTLNWNSNLTLFSSDIKYVPDSFDLQNNLGVALMRAGNTKEAKKHFEKSIELSSKWWISYNNLGVVYQREKNYEKAKDLYEKSIKNGGYYLAYENLATIRMQTEQPKDVLPFLVKTLQQLPNNATLNTLTAVAYYQTGATASAKLYAQKAYRLSPSEKNRILYESILSNEPL